jgi:hypothetical protein
MERGLSTGLFVLWLCVVAAAALSSMLPAAAADAVGPHLVIGPAAGEVVAHAGGHLLGPERAPFAVMADGASPEALRAAGAWAVTRVPDIGFFCIEGISE